jgi:MFS family permease
MAGAVGRAPDNTGKIFLYFGPLTFLVYLALPHGYFLDFTTSYMLKDHLHASAPQVAMFRFFTAVPVYLSVVFGFGRDLWNPLGRKDRGFFIVFAPLTALVFIWMALTQLSFAGLFAGMALVMITFRFIAAAQWGLMALVGQEKLMAGRLSALWNFLSTLPYVVGGFASGWFSEHVTPQLTFLVMAVLAVLIFVMGLWKPKAVFAATYDQPLAKGAGVWGDLKRLVRHRAVYAPVLLMFMFQFAPGSNTPLQFYLTNTLHASNEVYGEFQGIFQASFLPVFFLYGWLCRRFSLDKLLFWGIVITIPQMVPLAFIHSGAQALWLAVPIGVMGAVAAAAIYDLGMRSCPPGLQGTLMMMIDGVNQFSQRGGDVLGSKIYNLSPAHGFLYCVIAITVVYALMLPVMLLVPKGVMATADGQANPELDAQVLAEAGA